MGTKIQMPDLTEFKSLVETKNRTEVASHYGVHSSTIDHWRKIYNLPRKTFQYRNIDHGFSKEQIDIITGSLLGDGCLQVVGKHGRANSQFTETHSTKQLGLLEWKKEKLNPFSTDIIIEEAMGRKIENGKVVSDPDTTLERCYFNTIYHPELTTMERKWYLRNSSGEYILSNNKKRIKIVPDDLVLNQNIITVWFYDDGSNNVSNRQITFNTQSLSESDCNILIGKLKDLNIHCSLSWNRNKPIIMTLTKSYLDLVDMVKDKMPHECMAYKIDMSNYKIPNYSTRFKKKST